MVDYPQTIVPVNHIEPVPRRVRAVLAGAVVLDTTRALYVWEWPKYPQYYIPLADQEAVASDLAKAGIARGFLFHLSGSWYERPYNYLHQEVYHAPNPDLAHSRFALIEDVCFIALARIQDFGGERAADLRRKLLEQFAGELLLFIE